MPFRNHYDSEIGEAVEILFQYVYNTYFRAPQLCQPSIFTPYGYYMYEQEDKE